jgi:uncharacterized protein with FMN-binding domain
MRRAILVFVATVVGLVLLLSFKTHPASTALATPPAALGNPGSTTPPVSAATSGNPTTGATTVTGDTADTVYGPVQVRITLANGKITKVEAVEYPTDTPRDQEINSYAIPRLDREATAAKSARIDAISGATYTSAGYVSSLQSALDKARA